MAVRDAVGDGVRIMVDATETWEANQTLQTGRTLRNGDSEWAFGRTRAALGTHPAGYAEVGRWQSSDVECASAWPITGRRGRAQIPRRMSTSEGRNAGGVCAACTMTAVKMIKPRPSLSRARSLWEQLVLTASAEGREA